MDIPSIEAWPREERGTRPCRRLRSRGLVPAVLYGRGESNVMLSVREQALARLIQEHHTILQVEWDGRVTPVQIKEIQYDHLGDEILHADFNRISMSETVQVSVAIEVHGEPVGVKQGGLLEVVLHEVLVECLPTAVPESIRVEVAELDIGDGLRVSDLVLPEGASVLEDPEAMVVAVAHAAEIVEEVEEEPTAMAQPEVIGRAPEDGAAPEGDGGE